MVTSSMGSLWGMDRLGYPMLYISPCNVYMHALPVSHWQFEKFVLGSQSDSGHRKDAWYQDMRKISPRVSYSKITDKNYEGVFASCIRLEDAQNFAAWMESEYEIPLYSTWKITYNWLQGLPSEETPPLDKMDTVAREIWQKLYQIKKPVTLAEQFLMENGLLEWVKEDGNEYGGVGTVRSSFSYSILRMPDSQPFKPAQDTLGNLKPFGIRLIRK